MGEEKSNVVITEEGALSVKKLTFWEAAMIIVGANIGAGILGLAYSSRKAGWPILLMWLIIAGVFTTVSMLYVAETTLRTKKPMQLPGLAERYVGKLGAVLVFISVCANSIGCMISYTSGSGEILAELLGISPHTWKPDLYCAGRSSSVAGTESNRPGRKIYQYRHDRFAGRYYRGLLLIWESGYQPGDLHQLDLCGACVQRGDLLLYRPVCSP